MSVRDTTAMDTAERVDFSQLPPELQRLLGGLGDAGVSDETQQSVARAGLDPDECGELISKLLSDDDDED